MILVDKLAYSSKLRHKSPALKMLLATGSLLICVWAQSFILSLFVLAAMSFLAVFRGGVAFRRYLALLAVPLSFLALSTVAIIFHVTDMPSPLLSLKLGGFYLAVDRASLSYGGRLLLTALSATSCLYFLTLTTPVVDILEVLRRLRCPVILTELMFLIYRFIFVLLETGHSIAISQKCRLGNRDFKTSLKATALLFAVLLQRALFKSSLLYTAMESRCYDGSIRVLQRAFPATWAEKLSILLFLALLIGLGAMSKIYGGL